jgi:SAM-dependent methyltransferase
MGSLKQTLRREWYRLGMRGRLAADQWSGNYWREDNGIRTIPCRACPKFNAEAERCGIPFGSPLRKCVVAAMESNLRSIQPGESVLELGFGRRSLARQIIKLRGGHWTGIDPEVEAAPTLGGAGFGHAGAIPFADACFDLVCGIQSLEHWAQSNPRISASSSHEACLKEVWRVLKPGGRLYFDAPIHLHGHEMFILGDFPRILALFDTGLWSEVIVETWRRDREPLAVYPPPDADTKYWSTDVTTYDSAALDAIRKHGSVHLVTVKARRKLFAATN